MLHTTLLALAYGAIYCYKKWKIRGLASLLLMMFAASTHAQWQRVEGLPQVTFTTLFSADGQLYASTADRIYFSPDGGDQWYETAQVHAEEDEISEFLIHEGIWYAGLLRGGCYRSNDGGQTWQVMNQGLTGLGSRSIAAFAIRGDSLYAATYGGGVFVRSLSAAQTVWSSYNQNMPWGNVQSLTADGEYLLAGSGGNATLVRNHSSQTYWTEYDFDQFNGEINQFLAAFRDGPILLGAGSQGLYRSSDEGQTWNWQSTGVGLLELAKFTRWNDQTLLMMSKPQGSYLRSTNNQGLNWTVFQPSLPLGTLGFDFLALNNRLYCAALSGLWVYNPASAQHTPQPDLLKAGECYPNPVTEGFIHIPFALQGSADVLILLLDATGRIITRIESGELPAGTHTQRLVTAGLPDGIYFYTLMANGHRSSGSFLLKQGPN